MNKKEFIEYLNENLNYDEKDVLTINDVLENNNIFGKHNKDLIKQDFVNRLNISIEDADKLYNDCMELIVKGIFKR